MKMQTLEDGKELAKKIEALVQELNTIEDMKRLNHDHSEFRFNIEGRLGIEGSSYRNLVFEGKTWLYKNSITAFLAVLEAQLRSDLAESRKQFEAL